MLAKLDMIWIKSPRFTSFFSHHISTITFLQLDTLVTVVDAVNILNDFKSTETLTQRKLGATQDDQRPLSLLLLDQIEIANVVLVNKADLVPSNQVQEVC